MPKHVDLGDIGGPVLLFGGPYSNLQAFEALCAAGAAVGVSPDRMICTGDIVAYCGAPEASVAALRAAGCPVVAGNCERQLAENAPDCGCGFDAGSACDLLSVGWYAFARARMQDADRDWMRGLPDIISFSHAGGRYAVIHGGVTEVARFIWPNSPARLFEEEWDAAEATIGPVDHIIAGHCGVPFERECRRGRWINAGVIGMPPNDGGTNTRYALLRAGALTFHRLAYDVAGAAADMQRAGLPPDYRRALETGYWPSEDILPEDLRRAVSESG